MLKSITSKQFQAIAFTNFKDRRRVEKLQEVGARRESWTAMNILNLSSEEVSDSEKLKLVLRMELIPTHTLHLFGCLCAEHMLSMIESPDPRSVAAPAAKRAWLRGEISFRELENVRAAAEAAASTIEWVELELHPDYPQKTFIACCAEECAGTDPTYCAINCANMHHDNEWLCDTLKGLVTGVQRGDIGVQSIYPAYDTALKPNEIMGKTQAINEMLPELEEIRDRLFAIKKLDEDVLNASVKESDSLGVSSFFNSRTALIEFENAVSDINGALRGLRSVRRHGISEMLQSRLTEAACPNESGFNNELIDRLVDQIEDGVLSLDGAVAKVIADVEKG